MMDPSNCKNHKDYSLHDKDLSGNSSSSLDSGISIDRINFNKPHRKEKENSLSSKEYLRNMSVLQKLAKQEEQLKIDIMYEKLWKQEPVLLNTDLLQEEIAKHKELLQEARIEQKMRNVMCTNVQLANTFQRIVGSSRKTKGTNKKNRFEAQSRSLKELLKKKKEVSKKISAKRQEIAEVDEQILKLKINILNEQKRNDQVSDKSSICNITPKRRHKELKRLTQSNEKLCDRIRLLSNIIQSLVPHSVKHQKDQKSLSELMLECQKISSCKFNDLNDIKELLKNVCSVNL